MERSRDASDQTSPHQAWRTLKSPRENSPARQPIGAGSIHTNHYKYMGLLMSQHTCIFKLFSSTISYFPRPSQ
ncbi:hypothetical protein RRG08_001858 [Elysia crispata]|uniref:Uncharacterized protein n=1 Tax=Elysia crispata TaxID=231223 RepID=A0AAE1DS53_9GAST|nr:hypothetical protein RRG08_001858 [Elysia crispata]